MSISAISSSAFQAIQNATGLSEAVLSRVAKQTEGKSPFEALKSPLESPLGDFGKTLAARISEQKPVILQTPSVGSVASAVPPSTYKGLALQMIENTQNLQANAGEALQSLARGEGSLHNAMIAMEEASVSFQLLVEMRNKLVESLQEMMRMQI